VTTYTIKDIAKLAGVGVSTVSRALNNHPDINKKTKDKIMEIIEECNYSPNENAKHLKLSFTNNISIIVKGTANPFFENIVEQMQYDLGRKGYNAIVNYIDEHGDEIKTAMKLYNEKKLEGIIFLGGSSKKFNTELSKFHIPCVVSTVFIPDLPLDKTACVSVDDKAAAGKALDYLITYGHKNIAIIGGKRGYTNTDLRYQGAVESFAKHGLAFDDEKYMVSKFSLESSYNAMAALLEKDRTITAVFAMSDTMAIGAAKAITDAGLSIPEDISIIGFDGIDIAHFYNPTLATIKQPAKEIAKISVKVLIENILGECENNKVLLDTQLIKGNSVKRLVG
jgi:LacI family transcriptional regulator